jgi:hypothetical protein
MVDSLSPLPPISARIEKTQVTEKNPHHQNPKHQHQKKDSETHEEEIKDEIIINDKKSSQEENKPGQPLPLHNIDIEV